MKIYRKQNVYDAALERIRYLFNEFPEVVCGFSGGKDSTVCFHLCLQVARELGRLPLRVMWIDQEIEWQGTVDFVESIMTRPDVLPMWFQMPMVISDNASSFERFNHCWRLSDKDKWTHPQHPLSIKENRYGTELLSHFNEHFGRIFQVEFKDTKACYISGVRTSESPKRFVGLTYGASYKWITWGSVRNKRLNHYTFYPIYDWEIRDVWKAIYDNKWEYNRVYDEFYRYGVPVSKMRISNLHHETAIQDLILAQKIEPETWVRIVRRLPGANAIKHLKKSSFTCPKELPFMFTSWDEYAEHIIENIIQEESNRIAIRKKKEKGLALYIHEPIRTEFLKKIIDTVLSSDWDWTKLKNFEIRPTAYVYKRWRQGKEIKDGKYLRQYTLAGKG